ncbi:pentatricopeptide repeat-containing protein [Acrasis kona]|uniref:Pentatricopeptide repeat-containing protein n=1 Tax=Acrasis kona TaxID=1008807 RepID=A0AAW2Z288_9EUKA
MLLNRTRRFIPFGAKYFARDLKKQGETGRFTLNQELSNYFSEPNSHNASLLISRQNDIMMTNKIYKALPVALRDGDVKRIFNDRQGLLSKQIIDSIETLIYQSKTKELTTILNDLDPEALGPASEHLLKLFTSHKLKKISVLWLFKFKTTGSLNTKTLAELLLLHKNDIPHVEKIYNFLDASAKYKVHLTMLCIYAEKDMIKAMNLFHDINLKTRGVPEFYCAQLINKASVDDVIEVFSHLTKIEAGVNIKTLNRVINVLHNHNKIVQRVLDFIISRNMKPDYILFCTVLKIARDADDAVLGDTMYRYAIDNGIKPNEQYSSMVIKLYCSSGSIKQAIGVLDQFVGTGEEPTRYMYTVLLDSCAKNKDVESGDIVFDYMFKYRTLDIHACNCLIKMYSTTLQNAKVADMFDKMKEMNIGPNSISFLGAFGACVDPSFAELGDLVCSILKNSTIAVDTAVYNSVMTMYVKTGRTERAVEVFLNFKSIGAEPDEVSYNIISNACEKACSDPQGDAVFKYIQESNFVLTASAYDLFIKMYSNMNRPKQCVDILKHMINNRIQPDDTSFSAALNACSIVKDVESGNTVLKLIKECQVQLNVHILTNMIKFYGCTNRFKKAVHLFFENTKKGIQPNTATCCTALSICGQNALINNGRGIIKYIKKKRIDLKPPLISAIILFYGKTGSLNEAVDFFEESADKSNIVFWNMIIHCCAINASTDKALEFFDRLIALKVAPVNVTNSAVLRSLANNSNIEIAELIFSRLESEKLADGSCYNIMMALYADNGLLSKKNMLLKTMNEKGMRY